MYKIYNKSAITRQERFLNALIYGTTATIILTLVYGFIAHIASFEFSVVYLAIGYAIGYVIQRFGRGVQIQFSILAALLAGICFVLGDIISLIGFDFRYWLRAFFFLMELYLSTNINSLLSLAFRIGGIYFAFKNARIV